VAGGGGGGGGGPAACLGSGAGAVESGQAAPVPDEVGVESAVIVAQPAPDLASASDEPPDWWDYRPGDAATAEGLLYVHGYVLPDGQRQIFAGLTVQGPAGAEIAYLPLVGERLPELLRLDQLHVRVRGEIVDVGELDEATALQGPAPFGQVLRVDEVAQLWPAEVALLADERSGETVALPAEMARSLLGSEQDGETVLSLVGVREPGASAGGYPLLRVIELRTGDGAVAELEKRLESPLVETGPGEPGPGAVIVGEIRLAYRVIYAPPSGVEAGTAPDASSTELVYLLRGASPDGRYTVNLRLEPLQPAGQP
jgi:hypothetical protein